MKNPFSFFFSRTDDVAEQIRASGETAHQLYGELSISLHRLLTDKEIIRYRTEKPGDKSDEENLRWKGLRNREREIEEFKSLADNFLKRIFHEHEKNREFMKYIAGLVFIGFIFYVIYLILSLYFAGNTV